MDVPRVELLAKNEGFTTQTAAHRVRSVPVGGSDSLSPNQKHFTDLKKAVSKLEASGHLAHGPRTSADPCLTSGAMSLDGMYRLEVAELSRITMPGGAVHIWYGQTEVRHLFLCENWKDCHEPPLCSLWRGYDLAPIFNQLFFRPLIETTLDTSLLFAHQSAFRSDPVETLCYLGAQAAQRQTLCMLYGLRDTVYPLNDDANRSALFGCPIAIWEDQCSPPDETVSPDVMTA